MQKHFFITLTLLMPGFLALGQQLSLIPYRSGDEWGYCDPSRNIVIPTTFDMAYPFIGDVAFIKAGNTYSLINQKGETLGTYTFLSMSKDEVAINRVYYPFDETSSITSYFVAKMIPMIRLQGASVAEVFLDGSGTVNPKLNYTEVDGFTPWRRAVVHRGAKWGYLSPAGNEVIPLKFSHAQPFWDMVTGVDVAGKWGAIDTLGKTIIPQVYDTVYGCSEGICMVKKGSQVIALDYTGQRKFEGSYKSAKRFSEGLCVVYQDGKAGYVDDFGNVVIPLQYPWASNFHEGFAVVGLGNREIGLIDKTGNLLFKGLEQNIIMEGFSEGLSARKEGNLWGYVDGQNNWVVQPKYVRAEPFSCGLAKVSRKTGDGLVRSFFIDHQGNEYIDD